MASESGLNGDANIVEDVPETKRSREEDNEVKKTEKNDNEDHEKTKTVPFYKLFAFADSFDFLLMILGTLGSIGNGLGFPIMTVLFGDLVDAFGQNQTGSNVSDKVSKVALKFVWLGIGTFAAAFLQLSGWMISGERQASRIRSMYLKTILRQDIAFFDVDTNTGEVVGRMSGDTVLIQDAMGEKVGKAIQLLSTFIGGFVIAFIRGWLLTLVMLSSIPLLVMAGAGLAIVIARTASRGQTAYAKAAVVVEQTIGSIRTVAVSRSWQIKQLDVNNAFLQGTLDEEVYVTQPPGYVDPEKPDHVWRLRKALYGLKQAPRAWYTELKGALLSYGFQNSAADTSVFVYIQAPHLLYVLVYVDDIIVTGNDPNIISAFLQTLANRFSLKDPTDLTYFLGIEVTKTTQGLHLMQRKYVLDLLTRTNMRTAKSVSTPMASSPKLSLTDGHPLSDASEYRRVVGSLQYLLLTRPDLAYAVNRLSQFMHRPTDVHWQAVKRVLRYLAGNMSAGIMLRNDSPMTLHAFSDADWAGDADDYLSTNAYILYLGKTPIAWSSRKQKGVARSSTEAEYRAVANTASEVRWVCSLLTELGIALPNVPVIYCDNVGAIHLSANPVFHSRMKHLALDYHFIRELVQSGALRVSHVSTKDQLADALTKPLHKSRFLELFTKIGVRRVSPSCGGV